MKILFYDSLGVSTTVKTTNEDPKFSSVLCTWLIVQNHFLAF